MANEFVARRGIIAQSGGARITGSLLVSGTIDATGYSIIGSSFTGSFSGSIGNAVTSSYVLPSGLPAGTVSGSTASSPSQGTVRVTINGVNTDVDTGLQTSDSPTFTSITTTNTSSIAGVYSSSAQVTTAIVGQTISPTTINGVTNITASFITGSFRGDGSGITGIAAALPGGVISSSTQFKTFTDPFTGSFTGSFSGDGSNITGIATTLGLSGSYSGINTTGTVNLKTQNLIVSASNGISATVSGQTLTISTSGSITSSTQVVQSLPPGTVSSSTQIDYNSIQNKLSGVYSSSAFTSPSQGTLRLTLNGVALADVDTGLQTGDSPTFAGLTATGTVLLAGIYSSSAQTVAAIAGQTIAPTTINATNITASFISGAHTGTFPYASLTGIPLGIVSSSTQVQPLLPIGTVSSSAQYPGWVTASSQIDYNSIQNKLSGVYSSSTQAVAAIANQTIAPLAINTGVISGSALSLTGNATVGGALTVNGLLTAVSTSIQYVTSSQINIADNKILIGVNDLVRFGGISIVDSGSTAATASIFWDSLEHRFIYENLSGSAYNSAIFIAGPKNTGVLGTEVGLIDNRVPVGFAGDHIDNRAASSSIRVDFPSRLTHVEAGLFVTGNLTANGTIALQGIPSASGQIQALLPLGTVSSSAQYPGWVTASSQIDFTATVNRNGVISSSVSGDAQGQIKLNGVNVNITTLQSNSSPTFTAITTTGTSSIAAVYSSSTQVVAAVAGQTLAPTIVNPSISAQVNNTLYSGSTVTGIVGPVSNQVVASFATGSFNSAFFDYNINDGTNYRAGTVMSVWSPGSIEFTETSTADLGNTAQATFTVDILSGVARLRFSNTSGTWTVKTAVRAL